MFGQQSDTDVFLLFFLQMKKMFEILLQEQIMQNTYTYWTNLIVQLRQVFTRFSKWSFYLGMKNP